MAETPAYGRYIPKFFFHPGTSSRSGRVGDPSSARRHVVDTNHPCLRAATCGPLTQMSATPFSFEAKSIKPPKPPHVKEFQGDDRSDFQCFITDIRTFIVITGLYTTDVAKIGYADSRLSGSAKVWMTNLWI